MTTSNAQSAPEALMEHQRRLTEIELAIVRALARGMQSKEIATTLDRSRPTIEFHIRMLFAKMEARSRAQVVARGYELGLLEGVEGSAQI
ncbi:MAG: LuxR C-terminal-related transcriptional regulator [Vulcanimicrobiaceae bacterium]